MYGRKLKPRGKPFEKGKAPKSPGRPKGPSKATFEVRTWAVSLVTDPVYQANFLQRWQEGKLPPALEAMVHHYASGKPHERVELSDPNGGPVRFTLQLKDDGDEAQDGDV